MSYSKEIQVPIFNSSCATAGCHDAGRAGELSLMSYDELMDEGAHRRLVEPFDAEGSPLVWSLEGVDPAGAPVSLMPPNPPFLRADQIQTIKDWIDEGARNN